MSEGADRDGTSVCQLPGCTNVVEQGERGEERRYCCVSHRKTARRRRKERRAKRGARLEHEAGAPSPSREDLPDLPGPSDAPSDEECVGQDPPAAPARPPTEPAAAPRVLVPQPRSRWLRRPVKSYAARGLGRTRLLYSPPPLPTQPDWLRPADPSPPNSPDPAGTAGTLARRWGAVRAAIARRRAVARRRKAEAAIERKDAEAVLRGTPIPDETATPRRRKG